MARGMGPGSRSPGGKIDRSKIKKTIKNLLRYIGQYKLQLIFVVFAIVISAITGALASLFLRTLIDDYTKRLSFYVKFDLEIIPDIKNVKNLSEAQQKEKVVLAREPSTLDPTRYGDWEKNGRCIDF